MLLLRYNLGGDGLVLHIKSVLPLGAERSEVNRSRLIPVLTISSRSYPKA